MYVCSMYVCMYVCKYAMYVCVYVCMYVCYICTYAYVRTNIAQKGNVEVCAGRGGINRVGQQTYGERVSQKGGEEKELGRTHTT